MAIEVTPDGHTVVTGEHVDVYRLLLLIKAFDLEIKTGIKMARGAALTITAQQYGVHARTKKQCREQLANIYKNITGRTV